MRQLKMTLRYNRPTGATRQPSFHLLILVLKRN